jgi:hypothetical protein
MNAIEKISNTDRYARCIQTSKRVRWDIDKDVIRGRRFDVTHKFLPDGLSLTDVFTTPVGRRKAVRESDPGPYLCQHLWTG